jgi:signal transduction histidine kinase
LEAVIEQVLALLCDKLAMSKVIVRKRFKPGLPRVHASPDLLEQVFVNLILNAIKAMPGGGTIKITMGMSRGDIVEMRFADTGIGISREDLPKIFDPFFTTQPVGEGIGLGLAISHSIITKQGGTIEAVSRVGKGTTLIVRLRITRDNSCLATLAERQANYMLPITREIPVNT